MSLENNVENTYFSVVLSAYEDMTKRLNLDTTPKAKKKNLGESDILLQVCVQDTLFLYDLHYEEPTEI